MKNLQVGIIGCGGRGSGHALGYRQAEGVEFAACADIYRPAAERLAGQFGVRRIYADYREMLDREKLDVVSMCLWPADHLEAVLACVEAKHPPRLINAEKPMAPTFGEALRMHRACVEAGIALTFSHQRRFGPDFSLGRDLIVEGAIGDLQRMEMHCSNLFDWGTHWFDMMQFYNDDLDADWVMGQIGCAEDRLAFGARVETAGLSLIKWPNGVTGLLTTGEGLDGEVPIRIIGSAGMLEIRHGKVRLLREGAAWEDVPFRLGPVPGGDTTRHILDSLDCLREGRQSILCSENALRATELIFATYESARIRGRALLPLRIEDSPLLSMLESGEMRIPDWPAFLTEEEEEAGFRLLFNGRDLAGWQADPPESWAARGGILRANPDKPGLLRTEDGFSRFSLSCEFRLGSRAAAAIALGLDADRAPGDGLDIPLRDDRWDAVDTESTGGLAGILPPTENPNIGNSAWTWCTVSFDGKILRVNVRGVDTLEVAVEDCPELSPERLSGSIGLRGIVGMADFRNIMIKEEK